QRRSAGSNDGSGLRLEDLREVKVALDQNGKLLLADERLGQIQPVQRPPLRVNRRFRRVQVLRYLFAVHRAASKRDDRSSVTADRDHQAMAKPVDEVA